MGRGNGQDQQSSSLLYGTAPRRTDFAALLARTDPKAFYVHFERQFGERLLAYGTERLKETYPEPTYRLEVMLPGAGLPPDSTFEELLEEQDDDLYITCHVNTQDPNGNWGLDCYDGFYMPVEELLALGWHRDSKGLSDRCRAHLQEHADAAGAEE